MESPKKVRTIEKNREVVKGWTLHSQGFLRIPRISRDSSERSLTTVQRREAEWNIRPGVVRNWGLPGMHRGIKTSAPLRFHLFPFRASSRLLLLSSFLSLSCSVVVPIGFLMVLVLPLSILGSSTGLNVSLEIRQKTIKKQLKSSTPRAFGVPWMVVVEG